MSLPITFGTPENYRIESVVFNVTKVNLPFNAITGRPTLYQFMAIAHYGYLILKMLSPNDIIKIHEDCSTIVSMLEKLQALVAAHEVAASQGAPDQAPLSSHQCVSSSAPRMQPSEGEDVPVKVIQIGEDAT
jgi:hypothetical protein